MSALTFSDQRILALAAYDIIKNPEVPEGPERCQQVGALWYPTLLEANQRQHGGLIVLTILILDRNLEQKTIFGGPALCEDTRRLLVADVVASAYVQSKEWGHVHNKIKEWYPEGTAAPLFPAEAYIKPEAFAAQLGKPRKFELEKVLGVPYGDQLRETYANLYAVIHGTLWQIEEDIGEEWKAPGGVNALQAALYLFARTIDRLFKGEIDMKREG